MGPVHWLALALVATVSALAWTFVARYARKDWRATPEGRHLMFFTLALAVTTTTTLLFRFVFDEPEGSGLRLGVFIAEFAVLAWQLAIRNRLLTQASRDAAARSKEN